jgi:hypothetical protein
MGSGHRGRLDLGRERNLHISDDVRISIRFYNESGPRVRLDLGRERGRSRSRTTLASFKTIVFSGMWAPRAFSTWVENGIGRFRTISKNVFITIRFHNESAPPGRVDLGRKECRTRSKTILAALTTIVFGWIWAPKAFST